MSAVSRAVCLALLTSGAVTTLAAQTAELPPIFAPQRTRTPIAAPPRVPAARAGLSDHVRQLVTDRILADARAFETPLGAAGPMASTPFINSDGALLMDRMIVNAPVLRREQIEPREVKWMQFVPLDRVDRRASGITAPLFRAFGGVFSVNVLQGEGKGIDHGREFHRVEFQFKLWW
jgi:hypothetical protein